jgi:hypothetical protein
MARDSIPTFQCLAYTGAVMDLPCAWTPVVFDIAGLVARHAQRPALRGHDHAKLVGHTTRIKIGDGVEAMGTFSGWGLGHAEEIVGNAGRGFAWKCSLGVDGIRNEFVEEGADTKVNGRKIVGPVMIVREGEIMEVSFCPLAADDNTRVTITRPPKSKASHRPAQAHRGVRAVSDNDRLLCNIVRASAGQPMRVTTAAGAADGADGLRELVAAGYVRMSGSRPVPTDAGRQRIHAITTPPKVVRT